MEQLIFVGVLLLFSILEAVARKGKAGQGEGDFPPPDLPQEPRKRPVPRTEAPVGRTPPTYDEDPSFDDAAEEGRTKPEYTRPYGTASRAEGEGGSEGLIPADVWEEIQALARGDVPRPAQTPEKAPRQARPVPTRRPPVPAPRKRPPAPSPAPAPVEDAPARSRAPRAVRPLPPPEATGEESTVAAGTGAHAVHLTHPELGTPVAGRLTIYAGDTPRERGSEDVDVVRRLLSGGPHRLRQAVILQELLGPPVSLRDEEAGAREP